MSHCLIRLLHDKVTVPILRQLQKPNKFHNNTQLKFVCRRNCIIISYSNYNLYLSYKSSGTSSKLNKHVTR